MAMKDMRRLMKVKTEIIVLAALVPLALVFGTIIIRWPELTAEPVDPAVSIKPVPAESVPAAEPTVGVGVVQEKKEKEGTVLLAIENGEGKKSAEVTVTEEESVAEVMEKAAAENKLSWRVTDYGESMGVLVEEINGVAKNSGQNRYWYLYVNGELSPVGASQAKVKAGDEINWKYELSKEQ